LLQIRQQQEQITILQILVVVQAKRKEEEEKTVVSKPNTRLNIKVAKLPIFNKEGSVRATERKSKHFKSLGISKYIV